MSVCACVRAYACVSLGGGGLSVHGCVRVLFEKKERYKGQLALWLIFRTVQISSR